MRELLLWCVLALALVVVRAEEEQAVAGPIVQAEDEDLLADEGSRIDVARALGELFEFNDFDDITHDQELGVNRDARAMEEEAKAVVDPEDQARYNKFMDTFYRRLNADARSTIDPIDIPLIAKKSDKSRAKKEGDKKKVTADKDADKKGGNKKNKNKKNQKKGNKKKKTNKSNKKTARHPKNVNLEEVDDESANEEVAVAEEENHHIVTREAEEIEEDEGRSADPVEDEEDVDSDVVARRNPIPKAKKNNAKKGNKKGNNKNKNKNKKSKKNKKNNKSKRSANKKSKKGKKTARAGPQTSKASVTGIATLVRQGDVTVVNRKDGKELRSDFKIGPVSLKVNRKFGSGKDADVRTATASSPELRGKMHLYVAADGKAKITRFNIIKPSVVTTSGSLSKDENKRSGNNNFMESSIGRITPFAAKKLKLAARDVLQATESKN